jgi:purine-cytosine permease-like protein
MSTTDEEGIAVVPEEQRTDGVWPLMAIWGGITIIVLNFLLGATAFPAGVVPGIVAITVSLLLMGIVVYAATYIAATEGTAGTTAMRAPFGIRGRVIPALALLGSTFLGFGILTGLLAGVYGAAAGTGAQFLVPGLSGIVVAGALYYALTILFGRWIDTPVDARVEPAD